MTEFNELDLNKDVEDMDEEEAKKTLSQFMASHQENVTAYDTLQTELEETETEYQEKIDEKEERIAEFKEGRAQEAAEHVKMPANLLVDRFSIEEIDQIIEEAEDAEYSEEEEAEADEEEENLTTFSEKEEKGRADSSDNRTQYRNRAKQVLGNKNFPVSE